MKIYKEALLPTKLFEEPDFKGFSSFYHAYGMVVFNNAKIYKI